MSTNPSPSALAPPLVGNVTSVAVAGVNLTRLGLLVFNASASVTIWVSPTGTAAAVNGTDSVAVQPSQFLMLGPPSMPPWTNGLNAIASSGLTNVIGILEFLP